MSATSQDANKSNTPTFVSALVLGLVVFGALTVVFIALHAKYRKVFQPRWELSPEGKRPHELPKGILGWFRDIIREPNTTVLNFNGPDAYFFIRFLRLSLILFLPFWFLTWAILMPIAGTGGYGQKGLNMFIIGNVDTQHQNRLAAYIVLGVLYFVWILYNLHKEYQHFFAVRQTYLSSPEHLASARSRTVIISNVPANIMSEASLRDLAGGVVTGEAVEQVWLSRKVDHMEKIFDARNKECLKLEAGETDIQALAAKRVRKGKVPAEGEGAEQGDLWLRYIPTKKRPTHRLGLPLISKKVDTMDYSPNFIREQNQLLETERANLADAPLGNTAFIRFTSQASAHRFCELVQKQPGGRRIASGVDVVPEEVVWSNISMSPNMKFIRTVISWALTIGLIIIWLPLVAFVGIVSNINTLANSTSFLHWINKIPSVVQGIIQGILPPVMLAVLFMLLPVFLRLIVKLQGETRQSEIERKLFARFWLFQVIHGFLIVTVSSGIIGSLSNLTKNPQQAPSILAKKLPTASIFFLTFIITTSLSSSSKTSSRIVPFIMSKLTFLRGNTPRKAYAYDYKLASIQLSTAWPPIALLTCITIVYTIIQPVLVGFGVVAIALLYIAYKYLLIWVMDQPTYLETGGLMYNKALTTIFTSLYIAEICLTGLFFLLRKNADGTGGTAPIGLGGGIVFAITIAVTALYQIWLQHKYSLRRLTYLDPSYVTTNSNEDAAGSDAELVHQNRVEQQQKHAGEPYGNTTGLHERAFDNPATWKPQPVIWIADDTLGIGRAEADKLNAEGITASTTYTQMDAQGKTFVQRSPPDEAWYGGSSA